MVDAGSGAMAASLVEAAVAAAVRAGAPRRNVAAAGAAVATAVMAAWRGDGPARVGAPEQAAAAASRRQKKRKKKKKRPLPGREMHEEEKVQEPDFARLGGGPRGAGPLP